MEADQAKLLEKGRHTAEYRFRRKNGNYIWLDLRATPIKDEAGRVHERSAACTHVKCIVDWNTAEKSWDCPCHGSRFDPYGKVLNGPAIDDLHPAP